MGLLLGFSIVVGLIWAFVFIRSKPQAERGWYTSENGNLTRVYGNDRITVFGDGRLWKFCIADNGRDDPRPYFSDSYVSQSDAMDEAMLFVTGQSPSRQTNQENRRSALDDAVPGRLARQFEKLAEIEKTLSFYRNQKNPNTDKLAGFKTKVLKARSSFLLSSADFIASERVDMNSDEAFTVLGRYDEIIAEIEGLSR